MSERSEMQHWFIEDSTVRELLIANGFVCEKQRGAYGGTGIHIYLRTQEQRDDHNWYETDCPIQWNKQYELKDGSVIASRGMCLVLVRRQDQ